MLKRSHYKAKTKGDSQGEVGRSVTNIQERREKERKNDMCATEISSSASAQGLSGSLPSVETGK